MTDLRVAVSKEAEIDPAFQARANFRPRLMDEAALVHDREWKRLPAALKAPGWRFYAGLTGATASFQLRADCGEFRIGRQMRQIVESWATSEVLPVDKNGRFFTSRFPVVSLVLDHRLQADQSLRGGLEAGPKVTPLE